MYWYADAGQMVPTWRRKLLIDTIIYWNFQRDENPDFRKFLFRKEIVIAAISGCRRVCRPATETFFRCFPPCL
jgi:hypothetical protein